MKTHLPYIVICAAAALFLYAPPVHAATKVCSSIESLRGTAQDASSAVQACIDAAQSGDIIEFPAGKYQIARQVFSQKSGITLRTQGKQASMPRCNNRTTDCAEFVATSSFQGAQALFVFHGSNLTVDHLSFNGNQYARNHQRNTDIGGYNIVAAGNNNTFTNNVVKNALKIAAFWIGGESITVSRNLFSANGMRKDPWVNFVADGLIVADTTHGVFEYNEFVNGGTDVDMIFGSCTDCSIRHNTFRRTPHMWGHTNAALMFTDWATPIDTSLARTQVSDNMIDCGPQRRCTFGLVIGSHAWIPDAPIAEGGMFFNNTITNAQYGLVIDDHKNAEVYNNPVSNTTGFAYSIGLHSSGIDRSKDTTGTTYTTHDWGGKYMMGCLLNCDLPAVNAQFISQSVPTTMIAGRPYEVSITLKNTGFYEWNTSETNVMGLGSHNPPDNGTWGMARVALPAHMNVGINESQTFTFTVTAPSTPGTYNFQWRMLQDQAYGWFGDTTPNVQIQVAAPSPNSSDLNTDGKVDIFDYNILVANFGKPYTIFDYNTLIGNFGR